MAGAGQRWGTGLRASGKECRLHNFPLTAAVQDWQPALLPPLASLQGQLAAQDGLLPDLLVFPPGTDLHDHPLVEAGALILQSKASCMPAHALRPQPGWAVVDACAAPGNKTTHLAALMGNRGSIQAFEVGLLAAWAGDLQCSNGPVHGQPAPPRQPAASQSCLPAVTCCVQPPLPQKDARRCERLRGNAAATGSTIIAARCADFLATDPEAPEFAGVEAVLLDPSCSGSGTAFTRMDWLLPSSADRLKGGWVEGR